MQATADADDIIRRAYDAARRGGAPPDMALSSAWTAAKHLLPELDFDSRAIRVAAVLKLDREAPEKGS